MAISTNKGMLANSITTDYPNSQVFHKFLTKISIVTRQLTLEIALSMVSQEHIVSIC
jgi:hypothetical protein